MIIIIKSPPYITEKPLGALFIGLSSAEQNIPTKVIFLEDGLNNLFKDQNPNKEIAHPGISDIIQQLFGLVHFYAVESDQMGYANFFSSENPYSIVPGVKKIDYTKFVDMIISDPQNPIVL